MYRIQLILRTCRGKWGKVKRKNSSVSQSVNMWLFLGIIFILKVNIFKKS